MSKLWYYRLNCRTSNGVPGGKEREEADCPICREVLYSRMTDGWFDTSVVSIKDTIEPYKSEYLSK